MTGIYYDTVQGDFNLDYRRINDDNYVRKNLFADFDEVLSNLNAIQLIDFVTCSRIVGNELKESILDHIYTKTPTFISNIYSIMPLFGDHRMITFCVNEPRPKSEIQLRRDWRKYSKELLCNELKLEIGNLTLMMFKGFGMTLKIN